MANGIEIRLFDGATAQASLTGLTCLWWDAEDVYDLDYPQGRTNSATTDADGDLILDISQVSGHIVGGVGYLLVRKEDVGNHEDSLVFQGKVTVSDITGGTVLEYSSGWVRPADWLAIDDVHVSGESRFEALHAVYKDCPNPCAFHFTVVGGYDVDWGDGSAVESVASGVKAERFLDYTLAPASSETGISEARAVTFTDTGDLVTLAGHGFQNGTEISFSVITTTTGITAYTRYWVVGVAGNDFQVAATKGGAALPLTTNGTGSVYLPGYRQLIIKVTPTIANHFTGCQFQQRHGTVGAIAYRTGWLDVYLNGPSMTVMSLGGLTVLHVAVQQFSAPELATTSMGVFFQGLISLQSIPSLDTAGVTTFFSTFDGCRSLRSIPLIDTSSATVFSATFIGCSFLVSVPLINTSGGTTFENMFYNCLSLQTVPLLVTSSGVTFTRMFFDCRSLETIPLIDTSIGTVFTGMFQEDGNLKTIPLINTSSGTTFTNMFVRCHALQSLPLLDISGGNTLTDMIFQNLSLQKGALVGTKENINYVSCLLSGPALDEIYTNLATVVGKTITVTGNYGTATDDPTIATAKGWGVTD